MVARRGSAGGLDGAQRQPLRVGIDLGKTKMAVGLIDPLEGRVLQRTVRPTDVGRDGARIIDQLCEDIGTVLRGSPGRVESIGVATFGLVDRARGVALGGKGLPAYRDLPLRDILRRRLGLPVGVENDVIAGAIGEYRYGLGERRGSMALLSFGTSFGLATVLGGRVTRGRFGRAGQLAHVPIEPGSSRSMGDALGGAGLAAKASEVAGEPLSWPDALNRAAGGDGPLGELVDRWTEDVAEFVARLVCLFDPHTVVMTGSVVAGREDLIAGVQERAAARLHRWWPALSASAIHLAGSRLGVDAALLGAAHVAPRGKKNHVSA